MQHGMINNVPSGPSFRFRSGDCHDGDELFWFRQLKGPIMIRTASEQGLVGDES